MALTPEKTKQLLGDLGKATMRGIRKCPRCGTVNGTRGISCKNTFCNMIFKEREKRKPTNNEAVKIVTGSTVKIYSVRLRDRGPDYRGFVQLPIVQDMDGNPAELVDPLVLAGAARCYIETCPRRNTNLTHHPNRDIPSSCAHIHSSIQCTEEARGLAMKNSVLSNLRVSDEMKEAIWVLATETAGPLVQRVSKNVMVVKCAQSPKHPLGFLHFSFMDGPKARGQAAKTFQCSCRVFKSFNTGDIDDDSQRRCVHFYACICAFASDEKLSREFSYFINLDATSQRGIDTLLPLQPGVVKIDSGEVVLSSDDLAQLPVEAAEEYVEYNVELADSQENLTEVVIGEDSGVIMDGPALKNHRVEIREPDTLEEELEDDAVLGLQDTGAMSQSMVLPTSLLSESKPILQTSQTANILSTRAALPVVTSSAARTSSPPKHVTAIRRQTAVDEGSQSVTFVHWLASVTERINQTMHYQFTGTPEPLVFHAPQCFFDCLQQRISVGSKKKRLPNSTTAFTRRDSLPLGTFTKYSWQLTSLSHVKQVFDTPQMPLDVMRSFVENKDGTFDLYEVPKVADSDNVFQQRTPIRPMELKTFLRVGESTEKDGAPFIIEWIPNILPRSQIGELRVTLQYGHQRNGQPLLVDHLPDS